MKEQLINLKTAKIAKEKGFNIPVKSRYIETEKYTLEMGRGGDCTFPYMAPRILESQVLDKWDTEIAKAPTQSLLQKWLRDEFNIIVEAISHYDCTQLPLSKTNIVRPIGWFAWNYYDSNFSPEDASKFSTYEEALELGLQEGLKLIQTKEN